MKPLFVSALIALSLAGCDAMSRSVGPRSIGLTASVTEQSFTPLDLYFRNNCTGDLFLVTGTVHVVYTQTVTPGGHGQGGVHINFQAATGEDLSTGTRYNVISNQEGVGTYSGAGSASEHTTLVIFKLVGSGPNDNYTMWTHAHVTVNANGAVTVAFDKGEVVCQ